MKMDLGKKTRKYVLEWACGMSPDYPSESLAFYYGMYLLPGGSKVGTPGTVK